MLVLKVLVCACAVIAAVDARGPWFRPVKLVNITQGPVRGFKRPDADVYVFRHIPYATAPTGRDKFKAPLPPPTWKEPHGITPALPPIMCPQVLMGHFLGQEDCLIANLFVPDTQETNLPVLVVVHPGAFLFGLGAHVSAVELVDSKKVIVVTFNYRLGIHGFLCLGNEEAPGNAGMKDQVALLRWVQTNIAAFGGNPDDVTVAGCSASGVAADLLRLSKMTDGLLKKVIVASGGNTRPASVQLDPIANAQWLAGEFNVTNNNDITTLTDFFTETPLETLLDSTHSNGFDRIDSTFLWIPCVERDVGVERFLDDAPVNILSRGENKKLPVLYGFTDAEGLFRMEKFESWKPLMNKKFSDFLPGDLKFNSIEEKEAVATKVRQFYFGDEKIDEQNVLSYIDYFSDVMYTYPMLRAVKLNGKHQNTSELFLYEYSFTDENTPPILNTGVKGANHCDQFYAIFDPIFEPTPTESYRQMKTVLRKMVLDFVETGNPVGEGSTLPVWSPAGADRAPHMNLDATSSMRGTLLPERCQLWDDIYAEYYRTPIPPSAPTNAAAP